MRSARTLFFLLAGIIGGGVVAGVVGAHFGVANVVGEWIGGGIAGIVAIIVLAREDWTRLQTRAARTTGPYVSPFAVRFDDTEVVVTRKGDADERIAWADLATVGVRIDDAFLPQPWWLLFASGGKGVQYPGEAVGAAEMLHELQRRLPGFDNAGVIRAMGMMEGGVVLWQRAAPA
jgi:hypothetical protein